LNSLLKTVFEPGLSAAKQLTEKLALKTSGAEALAEKKALSQR
jgi:hypothetical protein